MNIAIDGPAGAGKSTIARLAAEKLGFIYVDTGAMYRALALYFINSQIDILNDSALKCAISQININIVYENGVQHVFLNSQDVSDKIRNEKVGNMASKSSAILAVREKLLDLQRNIARENDVIMDGRDIGTNILPDAELKIYLTASVDVRAERRYKELVEHGEKPNLEIIKRDIENRDRNDMNRANAPLKKADDAIFIDSSELTVDEVVNEIVKLADNEEKNRKV